MGEGGGVSGVSARWCLDFVTNTMTFMWNWPDLIMAVTH